ncbi:MAG: DUF885 family protein [Steroidobacteraceae bacterium]
MNRPSTRHPARAALLPLALAAALTLSCIAAAAAAAGPDPTLAAVLSDYDLLLADLDPVGAAARGDAEAARRWPDHSPANIAALTRRMTAIRKRLQALDGQALGDADALNRELLERRIDIDLEGLAFDEQRIPFTSDEGFFLLPMFAAQESRLRTAAEAEAYLVRLASVPRYFAIETANLRRGLATGFVQPRLTAAAAATIVRALADQPAADSPLLEPLKNLPSTLPKEERERLYQRGLEITESQVIPTERALADFFEKIYVPKARSTLGASRLPNGKAYYSYLVRRETTSDLTPDQIYELGRSEIARIRKAMDGVIAAAGFKGSFSEFQRFLRTDPQFYATSREQLLEKASRIAKRIDDQLPGYFGTLPRLTYGVRPVPAALEAGYTSGRYNPGSPVRGVAGGLMINTSFLDQRPLYELPALVAHEGVPGHHLQIAVAQEQAAGVPEFRKQEGITAYVEGWALYTEQLAAEMGIYQTPYERFGMLSMEMWRACRLFVDVGIHWKGMSRDEAVACLRDNSALADKNIQNEVNRYISWPGQALGYKIGELKIMELRHRAEATLGPAFDVRKFHDVVLLEGAMPLTVLERRVDAWIAAQRH